MYLTSEVSANMWYRSRSEAAETNPRLGSREGLAEETGISRNRIVRIEAGTDMPTPDEARLIAMACNKPEIQQYYCRECCPLGRNMPKITDESLDRLTIRAMNSMGKVEAAKELLLSVMADGVVEDEEMPGFQKVIALLDDLNEINVNLKVQLERSRKNGKGSYC